MWYLKRDKNFVFYYNIINLSKKLGFTLKSITTCHVMCLAYRNVPNMFN